MLLCAKNYSINSSSRCLEYSRFLKVEKVFHKIFSKCIMFLLHFVAKEKDTYCTFTVLLKCIY